MSKRGYRRENELANKLWEEGFAVVRTAGSGSRKRPQPDLIVGNEENGLFGIEIKSSKDDHIYVPKGEIEMLRNFCERLSTVAIPVLAIKFTYQPWRFVKLSTLEESGLKETDNNYGVDRDSKVGKEKLEELS